MEKKYIVKIFNKVMITTVLWTIIFVIWGLSFAQSLMLGLVSGVIIEGIFPFTHEFLHKMAYQLFHSDAKISIHLGNGLWYVFDESEYVYSKKEMIVILLAPIVLTIIPVFLLLVISNPFIQVLLGFISLANLLGMIGTPKQKGDILYALEMIKENKLTYKFAKGAQLIKM